MSVHSSLKIKNALQRPRNVFTRHERLLRLRRLGILANDSSAFGLPKTKVPKIKKAPKVKKKVEEVAEGEAAAAASAAPSAPAGKK